MPKETPKKKSTTPKKSTPLKKVTIPKKVTSAKKKTEKDTSVNFSSQDAQAQEGSYDQEKMPIFDCAKVFVSKSTFEIINPDEIAELKSWNPQLDLHIDSGFKKDKGAEDQYTTYIVLRIALLKENSTVKLAELSVKQSATFFIKNFEEKDLNKAVKVACPQLIFPYARQSIDNLLIQGGLPPLMLAPINFEYLHEMAKLKTQSKKAVD